MTGAEFEKSVFINCPFSEDYAPILEAILFCVVYFRLVPRLASERLEAGESRLDKIIELIQSTKYSIHDLSMCRSKTCGEYFRMNMPFELGVDLGVRRAPDPATNGKKFLIFEEKQYDLKRALSDLAGQDVAFHNGDYQTVIRRVREFFRVEAGLQLPGARQIVGDHATFQGWMMEKKIDEGHSEDEAKSLPVLERLDEMRLWIEQGKPAAYR